MRRNRLRRVVVTVSEQGLCCNDCGAERSELTVHRNRGRPPRLLCADCLPAAEATMLVIAQTIYTRGRPFTESSAVNAVAAIG